MSISDYTTYALGMSGALVITLVYMAILVAERSSTLQKLEATIIALATDQTPKGLQPATRH